MTNRVSFDKDRMTRQEAADYLGLSESTLRNWAVSGDGPPFYKTGKIYYRRTDLDEWIESRKRTRTET